MALRLSHFTAHTSLIRDGTQRPYPRDLLSHPFIRRSEAKNVNMAKWIAKILSPDPI